MFQNCFGIDFSDGSPITKNEKLLAAVFGGIISGIGSGLTIRFGGAIDGVEVLSLIFAKKIGMTVGTFVMSYNLILYISAGIITSSWITPLYSIIAYALGLKSVDFIIEGFDKSKSAFIISNHPEKIADTLVDIFERGVTIINAEGYYSKMPKKVLYCVVNRFEVNTLKKIVTGIDPKAFVAITDVSDSMGSSLKFDKLRERKRRKRKNNSPAPIVNSVDKVNIPDEILENINSIENENSIVLQDNDAIIEQENNAIEQNGNLQIEQTLDGEQKAIESQATATIDEKQE